MNSIVPFIWAKAWAKIPALLTVLGLCLIGYFGYDYAMQTWFLHDHSLPQYQGDAHLWTPVPKDGTQIGKIEIPSIHLTDPMIQGTEPSELKLGVGHYTHSALPGQQGNVVLAGHRDTVFTDIRRLKKGDRVILQTPYGRFEYEVVQFRVVPQTDMKVVAPTRDDQLTLLTCYPFLFFGFAPDRYVVNAKLVSEPKGMN